MTSSPYVARPWRARYSPAVPADLPLPQGSAIDQFRAAARRVPTSPAIFYFDTPISFGELDALSNSLAAALAGEGVGAGERVALLLQNMPQFWIAQLAVWKLGAIVVPLNPMFKAQELTYHLADSGAVAIIALESLYETVAQAAAGTALRQIITTNEIDLLRNGEHPAVLASAAKRRFSGTLDMLDLCAQHMDAADPGAVVSPADVAFLTYTSGTTGRPKGAMNTHANVAYNAEVYRIWMDLQPGDVAVGIAPLFHISGSIAYLAAAGHAGIPVILAYRFDAGEILRLVERWRGTFTLAAITAFNAMLNHADIRQRDLSSFRKAFTAGAPVAPALVEQFHQLSGVYLHNLYGLTETTSPSHAVPLGTTAPVDPETGALSVGLPVPGAVVKVVDPATGIEMPVGEIGEFITWGPMIVAGYWQKPNESANAIREGWLYTGDIGRMDQEGWFYLLDRKKDLIIASGFKVWPREVEDALYQHPDVREAAVVGVADSYRGETVKAFVALKADHAPPTPEQLIAFCRERLAAYKVPRTIEIVDELPKTATGKILRRELRQAAVEVAR